MGRKPGGDLIAEAIDQYKAGTLTDFQPRKKPMPMVGDKDQAIAIALRERDEQLGQKRYGKGPSVNKGMYYPDGTVRNPPRATFKERFGKWPDPVRESDDGDSSGQER